MLREGQRREHAAKAKWLVVGPGRSGEAERGRKAGECRQEERRAASSAERKNRKQQLSTANSVLFLLEIFLKVSTFEGAWLALASRRVMSYTDSQTAKIATLTFVTGVAVGFVLNNRLRRWLNGY